MSIEELLRIRSAEEYADFVLPSLRPDDRVLDVGCGAGSITLGLAEHVAHVTGVDVEAAEFAEAREHAAANDIGNVEFAEGSILGLGFPDASFDACTVFAMLETVEDPVAGLREIHRVLRPGGLVSASSIEYGGLILAGPDEPLLRRFYHLRLQIWEAQGDVDIHAGRKLRGRLAAAGFEQVKAWIRYFSYGTPERVRWFGLGRAADCRDEWYVDSLTELGLADPDEIDELERAWIRWAEAPDAFAAFAWGRATGRRP